MLDKNGRIITSCIMTHDTQKSGNCASCMYYHHWRNTRSLKEGDPGYCNKGETFLEGR